MDRSNWTDGGVRFMVACSIVSLLVWPSKGFISTFYGLYCRFVCPKHNLQKNVNSNDTFKSKLTDHKTMYFHFANNITYIDVGIHIFI